MAAIDLNEKIDLQHKIDAANGYVMSFVVVIVGLPLPSINFIAALIYYFNVKDRHPFIKFHALQSLVSQFFVMIINIGLTYQLFGIFFLGEALTNTTIGYIIFAGLFDVIEFIILIIGINKARKGIYYRMPFAGEVTAMLMEDSNTRSSAVIGKTLLETAALVSFAALFIWAANAIPIINEGDVAMKRRKLEKKAGEKLMEGFLMGKTKIENEQVAQMTEEIMGQLETESDIEYKIIYVEDAQVNAFATLGGNIVVYSGLFSLLDSTEELTAILAHEMGHNEKRHVVKNLGLSVITSILVGDNGGGQVMKTLMDSKFSRTQEAEADEFAHALLQRSDLNPAAMCTVFAKLKDYEDQMGVDLPEIIRSHPASETRMVDCLENLPKEEKSYESFDKTLFESVKASMVGRVDSEIDSSKNPPIDSMEVE